MFEDLAAYMLAQDEDLRGHTHHAMNTPVGIVPRGADVVVLPKRTRRRDGVSSSSVSRAVTIFDGASVAASLKQSPYLSACLTIGGPAKSG